MEHIGKKNDLFSPSSSKQQQRKGEREGMFCFLFLKNPLSFLYSMRYACMDDET